MNSRSTIHRALRPRAVVAVLVAAIALLGAAVGPTGAQTSDEPGPAADAGATWLVSWIDPDGYLANPDGSPDVGATRDIAVALAGTGTHEDTFGAIMSWMQDDVETVIELDGADSAGSLGYLLLLADAADLDPTDFGGVDLVDRLAGTLDAFEPGLYGAGDPTFDGVFRQSIAVLGQLAVGATPPSGAVDWLVDQQCDATDPAAEGGWEAYRADPSAPCGPPDPAMFTGPDTNSTAVALQAFQALGQSPDFDPLAFLAASQGADGGFPYVAGGDVDPNSTALVIQAILAAGEDPSAGSWDDGGANPYTSLLSWQLGCDSPDAGGFASPFSDGEADLFASRQAVWGLAGQPFPFGTVSFGPADDPCADPDEPPLPLDPEDVGAEVEVEGDIDPAGDPPALLDPAPVGAAPAFTG